MNEKENRTYTKSFTFNAGPLKFSLEKELDELAKLANDGKLLDWKSAIIIAATYLEMRSLEILLQKDNREGLMTRFKNMKKPPKKKEDFQPYGLFKGSLLLLDYGLITQEQYAVIDSIRKERNKIVHNLRSENATEDYNPRINPEANEKYRKMVNNAKELIESLGKSSAT